MEKEIIQNLLPSIAEIETYVKKYVEAKIYSGYNTGTKGINQHFKDGVDFVINHILSKIKEC